MNKVPNNYYYLMRDPLAHHFSISYDSHIFILKKIKVKHFIKLQT